MAKVGRKSYFNEIERHREKILELAGLGYINKEIAQYIGMALSTFQKYLSKNIEFADALKRAKLKSDITVENAMYKRAIGYDVVEEQLEYIPGIDGGDTMIKSVKKIKKHIAGSEVAMFYWLKNRRPDRWKDKQDIQISGEVFEKIQLVPAKKK